jgi:hypothetical protein
MTNTDTNAPYSNLERDILTTWPSCQKFNDTNTRNQSSEIQSNQDGIQASAYSAGLRNNNNNNNLMLISRKFTFIYDQMRVTTVEIKITLYE